LWDEWWDAARGRMKNLDDMWEGCPGDVSPEGFDAVGVSGDGVGGTLGPGEAGEE